MHYLQKIHVSVMWGLHGCFSELSRRPAHPSPHCAVAARWAPLRHGDLWLTPVRGFVSDARIHHTSDMNRTSIHRSTQADDAVADESFRIRTSHGKQPIFFFFCFFLFFFLSLVSENWEEDVGYVQEEPLYLNNKDEDEMWPPNNLRECRQNIPWLSILNRSKKFTLVDTQELKRNRRICHSFVLLIKFKLVLLIEFRLIYVFEFEFEFLNRVF